MTSGNEPIHDPRTDKRTSVQSLQDVIEKLENRLLEMKAKMVGVTYCLVNVMLSSASYTA